MGLYRRSSHVYWRCKYHLVWIPRYRYNILKDKVEKRYRTIYILCNMKDDEVLGLNVQSDPVHLVEMILPKLSILTRMDVLKGHSAIADAASFDGIR